MTIEQGDILLIPVPFTDLSSQKRRPVLVISNTSYNRRTEDVVVVAMTSNPAQVPFSFTVANDDLAGGHLNRPTKVRVDRIYTLSQAMASRTFGQVKPHVLARVKSELIALVST